VPFFLRDWNLGASLVGDSKGRLVIRSFLASLALENGAPCRCWGPWVTLPAEREGGYKNPIQGTKRQTQDLLQHNAEGQRVPGPPVWSRTSFVTMPWGEGGTYVMVEYYVKRLSFEKRKLPLKMGLGERMAPTKTRRLAAHARH
jgi:hypothetical protein